MNRSSYLLVSDDKNENHSKMAFKWWLTFKEQMKIFAADTKHDMRNIALSFSFLSG